MFRPQRWVFTYRYLPNIVFALFLSYIYGTKLLWTLYTVLCLVMEVIPISVVDNTLHGTWERIAVCIDDLLGHLVPDPIHLSAIILAIDGRLKTQQDMSIIPVSGIVDFCLPSCTCCLTFAFRHARLSLVNLVLDVAPYQLDLIDVWRFSRLSSHFLSSSDRLALLWVNTMQNKVEIAERIVILDRRTCHFCCKCVITPVVIY